MAVTCGATNLNFSRGFLFANHPVWAMTDWHTPNSAIFYENPAAGKFRFMKNWPLLSLCTKSSESVGMASEFVGFEGVVASCI